MRALPHAKLEPFHISLAMHMREIRLSRNLTLTSVAKSMGVTVQKLSYYEVGVYRTPLLMLVQWCRVLDLDPGEVVNVTVERSREAAATIEKMKENEK